MLFFKRRSEKELDAIIHEMKQFLSNNYKDLAHSCRKELLIKAEEYYSQGKLKEEKYKEYKAIYEKYTVMLKDYKH